VAETMATPREPATPRTPRVFTSSLRDERNAAILGLALGISFTVCFVTGVLSHLIQDPPSWFQWPSRPAGLYRVTQGVHVATGLAAIPLLLAKLWVVYPKLFAWPPFTSVAHLLERLAIFPLVAGGVFELFTGLADTHIWYPWPFNFRTSHYWVAWITIGALVVHLGAKWTITRAALFKRKASDDALLEDAQRPPGAHRDSTSAFDRRTFLATVFAAAGAVTIFTVGQTVRPLRKLALLAPRRPDAGPQGFPVNRTAGTAGVLETARSPDYRLSIEGKVRERLSFTREDLRSLPQHEATLPISCVEGWSTSQRWRGVRVRDLLERAGAASHAEVRVHSLQRRRAYRSSDLNRWQAHDADTLLALEVNGEQLDIDHGFPLRLIGPNRPGVQQTKWVTRLDVL
jgi:DMSO/TMAO reductase YedYZ molybdopterin-dependent catalytic subunit